MERLNVRGARPWTVLSTVALATGCFVACGGDDGDSPFFQEDGGDEASASGGSSSGGKGGSSGAGAASSDGGRGGSSGAGGSGGAAPSADGGPDATPEAAPDGEVPDSGPGEAGMDVDAGPLPARIRLVHASSAAADIDVYAAGASEPIVEDLAYGDATSYLEVEAGTYSFELRVAGDEATTDPIYTIEDVALEAGASYTSIAVGDIASMDEDDEFRTLLLEEGFAEAAEDTARVRIVHGGHDAPTVGIDVGNDDPTEPEVADLQRFAATDPEGAELPSGTSLQVGVVANDEVVTAFTTPELDEGDELIVIATGELVQQPREYGAFSLLVVAPDSSTAFIRQNPRMYLLHASWQADAVDVYIGEEEIADNVDFGSITATQLPPGNYDVDFFAGLPGPSERPGSTPSDSLSSSALNAGEQYLRVVTGLPGTASFRFIGAREAFELTDTANARLRAVHAVTDVSAPTVDIGTVVTPGTMDDVIFLGLGPRAVSADAGAAVAPGSFTLGIAHTGETQTDHEVDASVVAGDRKFVVAAGSYMGGNPSETFRFFVVDTTVIPWTMQTLLPD